MLDADLGSPAAYRFGSIFFHRSRRLALCQPASFEAMKDVAQSETSCLQDRVDCIPNRFRAHFQTTVDLARVRPRRKTNYRL
jgi:hypothetical protein